MSLFYKVINALPMIKTGVISMLTISAAFSVYLQNELETKPPKFEIKVITSSIESRVPMGLGRLRLISSNTERDYKEFSSKQTEDYNTRNKAKCKTIRLKDFEESKQLNNNNMGGICFQNIASNDPLISSKRTGMLTEG